MSKSINTHIDSILSHIKTLEISDKIKFVNLIRSKIHEVSPFKNEPIDLVLWVPSAEVKANDYNPNSVAPPEMELLRLSINNDGYTQPIVSMKDEERGVREVIDGFHRNIVGTKYPDINDRIFDHLPLVNIKQSQSDRNNRIASTIRHNRARGKHGVDSMSDIVVDLKKRNWSPAKIGRELGMDPDEVLRLTQISGLVEMFKDKDFSMAWDNDEDLDIEN